VFVETGFTARCHEVGHIAVHCFTLITNKMGMLQKNERKKKFICLAADNFSMM